MTSCAKGTHGAWSASRYSNPIGARSLTAADGAGTVDPMSDDAVWDGMLSGLDSRKEVVLGANMGDAHVCSAYPDPDTDVICGVAASRHIVWDGEGEAALETSFTCDEHLADALTHFKTHGAHAISEHCAQPGAVYVIDLDICVPGDGLAPAMAERAALQATLDLDLIPTTGA